MDIRKGVYMTKREFAYALSKIQIMVAGNQLSYMFLPKPPVESMWERLHHELKAMDWLDYISWSLRHKKWNKQ